jgi:hypothetical protein
VAKTSTPRKRQRGLKRPSNCCESSNVATAKVGVGIGSTPSKRRGAPKGALFIMTETQAKILARLASIIFFGAEFYVLSSSYSSSFHILGEQGFGRDGRDGDVIVATYDYGLRYD